MSGIWTSLPVARKYRAQEMVIGVVGWGGVGSLWGWERGWGGASSLNTVDIFFSGEYLCSGTVVGVVDSFPSTIEPGTGLSLINLSERCCPLSLCLSSLSVIPIWLLIPSQDGESCPRCRKESLLELWRQLSGWWGRRLLGDLYGLIPVYDRSVGGWGPRSVGIGSLWEKGSVGEVEVAPENVELKSGVGW